MHITDEELLKAADGEVSSRQANRIQTHLAACWQCRARRAALDRTIADFVEAHHREAITDLPPIEGPRALLRARLGQIAASAEQTPWQRIRQTVFDIRRTAYVGLAFSAVAAIGLVMYFSVQDVGAASIPNAQLTPGATRNTSKDDICSGRHAEGFYPIPATLAYRVFEKYRIENPGHRSYEVDYLITPALGGADDIRNLWPQPYASGEWNAHVKDALEDHLHRQVCSGNVELETAQRDISLNWIAAYRKYFKTERPLEHHASFSIDPPWED
jgi:hypothetical protein